MLEKLSRWLEKPIDLMLGVALAAGFVMMVHVSAEVTARSAFNHPLPGSNEIVASWYMITVAFLPWAWLSRRDAHIVAEMFTRIGSARLTFWLEIFVKVCTALFVGLFAWQTWIRAAQQTSAGEVWEIPGGFIPIWPCRWMLPIAAALMGLDLVLRILIAIRRGPPA